MIYVGGLKHVLFSPWTLGRWYTLTISIFFNRHQLEDLEEILKSLRLQKALLFRFYIRMLTIYLNWYPGCSPTTGLSDSFPEKVSGSCHLVPFNCWFGVLQNKTKTTNAWERTWKSSFPFLGDYDQQPIWVKGSLEFTLTIPQKIVTKSRRIAWSRWWFQIFFMFTPIWGRWTHFDEHIFQMGWNHQAADSHYPPKWFWKVNSFESTLGPQKRHEKWRLF